jgi:hypothetical protein
VAVRKLASSLLPAKARAPQYASSTLYFHFIPVSGSRISMPSSARANHPQKLISSNVS